VRPRPEANGEWNEPWAVLSLALRERWNRSRIRTQAVARSAARPGLVGVNREYDVCGDEFPSTDLVEVGNGRVCSSCHGTLFVDGSTDTADTKSTDDRSPALEAFADTVESYVKPSIII